MKKDGAQGLYIYMYFSSLSFNKMLDGLLLTARLTTARLLLVIVAITPVTAATLLPSFNFCGFLLAHLAGIARQTESFRELALRSSHLQIFAAAHITPQDFFSAHGTSPHLCSLLVQA